MHQIYIESTCFQFILMILRTSEASVLVNLESIGAFLVLNGDWAVEDALRRRFALCFPGRGELDALPSSVFLLWSVWAGGLWIPRVLSHSPQCSSWHVAPGPEWEQAVGAEEHLLHWDMGSPGASALTEQHAGGAF